MHDSESEDHLSCLILNKVAFSLSVSKDLLCGMGSTTHFVRYYLVGTGRELLHYQSAAPFIIR
jgi:hypothetical protein